MLTALMSVTSTQATAISSGQSVEMKLLVISADGAETDYPAITVALDRVGVPYDTMIATQTELTAAMLSDSPTHGRYAGIVLTTGNLIYFDGSSWPSAFTPAEWQILHDYQTAFGIRSVTSFTFPEAAYGLNYVTYQDTLVTPMNVSYTTAGRTVFPYANAANPVTLKGAWVYLGTVVNPAVTTPLITATVGGATYPIASVTQFNGYENLAITVANNPFLVHSMTFAHGWISWVSRGVFVGSRHANWNVHIDDLFIDNDLWDVPTNQSGLRTYRNRPTDVNALRTWTIAKRAQPNTPGLRLAWAFNGIGSVPGEYPNDQLTPSIQANKAWFEFINHTYEHFNLDCGYCENPNGTITTDPASITAQIQQNIARGQALGLSANWATMVQPDISGIDTPPNPMAQQTAADAGIRWWISDTSRPGHDNPTFNTGFAAPGDSRLYIVPRHPTNQFYNVSTPAEWTDEYNYFYGPGGILCGITTCFTVNQTYNQILDHESEWLLRYLLTGDLDPLMFHTPNVRNYGSGRTLLTDLLDATLTKYNRLVNVPIRAISFDQAGTEMKARAAFNNAGLTATINGCTSITLRVNNAATIPVTGVSYSAPNSIVELYAGQTISNITLTAGQSVTIPYTSCTAPASGGGGAAPQAGARAVAGAPTTAKSTQATPVTRAVATIGLAPKNAAVVRQTAPAPYNPKPVDDHAHRTPKRSTDPKAAVERIVVEELSK